MNRISLAAVAVALGALPAAAASIGFTAEVTSFGSGVNANVPRVLVTNDSTFADITQFSMTIGDTGFNFDIVYPADNFAPPPGGTITVAFGDTTSDTGDGATPGLRSDLFTLDFTGFGAGETSGVQVDIDEDNSDSTENFTNVLFNNGLADNSMVSATFSTGQTLSATFGDLTSGPYTVSASRDVPDPGVIPLPAGLPLALLGLGALGIVSRRRRG